MHTWNNGIQIRCNHRRDALGATCTRRYGRSACGGAKGKQALSRDAKGWRQPGKRRVMIS